MDEGRRPLGLILGVLLIGSGLLFLLAQLTGFDQVELWPLIIIGLGGAFFVGMFLGGKPAGPLAIPGSIIAMIGLILMVQNIFDIYETWSFAWALIIVAVGIGIWINGKYSERPDQVKSGIDLIRLGLILFVIFGLISTVIFNSFGVPAISYAFWGIALGFLGLWLLIYRSVRLVQGKAKGDERDLFWPVIFIGVALALLLIALGYLPWIKLTGLARYWPMALIAVGFDLLVGRRWPIIGVIMATLLVAFTFILLFDPGLSGIFN